MPSLQYLYERPHKQIYPPSSLLTFVFPLSLPLYFLVLLMIFMWFSDSCVVFRSQEGPFKAVRAPSNTWHEQFTVHVMVHLTPYQQGRVPIRRATQKSDSSRFRVWVSGFGFRRLKLTLAVRFGIRVSGFVDWNPLSLSVSGFGFRVSSCVDWNPLLLSVSGFGFRVSSIETHFCCLFRDSGFGFRVSSIEANFSCPFWDSFFLFRVSGFVDWS